MCTNSCSRRRSSSVGCMLPLVSPTDSLSVRTRKCKYICICNLVKVAFLGFSDDGNKVLSRG